MLRILSSILVFFKTLCVKNPAKIIFLILASISLPIAYHNQEKEVDVNQLVFSKVDGSNYFKVHTSDDGRTYVLTHDSVKPDSYKMYSYSALFIATSIIGGISLAVFIIGLFMSIFSNDNETKWNFDDCFLNSINSLIHCDIEDGKFHYTIYNRLIGITDKQLTGSISYKYNLYSLDNILVLPKFKTRSKSRDEKLDKLGVK